jgi:hypothetical protein
MSVLFGIALTTSAPAQSPYIPLPEWQAEAGDRLIVDTQENMGYIVHESGQYTSMRVGSGKKKIVNYIGRTYDATTPDSYWIAKSSEVQGDKITFGPTGRFLRLYDEGADRTAYGIHATANIKDILASADRYKSYGCVLVDDSVMDILIETFELNGNMLEVVTTTGIEKGF